MGVRYVKVKGRKEECPCSVHTEKGILWDYPGDNYRHFQTLCGPCAEDLFGDINMFKLPIVTMEEITEIRPESAEECCEIEEKSTVDTTQASPSVVDMLANLARRVTSLEQQLRDTQGNVERQAEELAEIKHLTHSNEADIAMLDERTQPKETPFFSTYTPKIYFNFDAKGDTAEEIAQRIIEQLYRGERR